MKKRTKMMLSVLLALCMLWTSIPVTAVGTDDGSTTPVEGAVISAPTAESSIIPPEDAAPLLDEDCQILRYVDETAFAQKGHVARLPGEETLSSYVFQNEDGSRTVYYMDEPVKYRDSTGAVWEKDLTLRPTTNGSSAELMGVGAVAGYTTTSNDVGLTMPNDPANGIRLSYAGDQIMLIPQGGTLDGTAQTVDGAVVYPDYFGKGMSLRYTPTLDGVKEDIILKAYTGVNSFTFLLDTGGLGLYQENGRYYLASSQTDETRFELGDVVTFDARGRFSVGTMTVETVTASQRYRLTLTVDEDFLTDSATTYPVTIDPTVTIANASNSDGDAIEDATIYSGAPDMNANWTYLHAGYYDSTYKIARTMFRFPGLTGSSVYQFPSEFEITSVEFHIREATGTSPVAVGLYANSSDYRWSESTVTWNYADFTLTKQYATASPGYGNETVYDITDLVHAWQAGEEDANMGITLKSSNETSVDKAFYATEYSTSSYRPYVTLTYDSEIELNKSVVNLAPNGTTTITAETAVAGGTITWSSSDTSIATVAKTGTNTCQITAVKSGVTTITATVNDGPTASCTVYVSITNGVYFIGFGSLYLSVDGGMKEGSTLTLQAKKSGGPAQFRQLWKITHIGQHYYSIRSLYRPDLALHANDDGTVDVAALSTSITGSDIPLNRRWKISRDGSGYLFHFAGTSNLELRPQNDTLSAGNDVVVGFQANDTFSWTLGWGPTVEDQVLLINTQSGLPAYDAVRCISVGDVKTLDSMNLTASFISKMTITPNFTWESSKPSVVVIDKSTGTITAQKKGTSIISGRIYYNNQYRYVYFGVCVGYPDVFEQLLNWHCIAIEECAETGDGLFLATTPLSEILTHKNVTSIPKDADATNTWNVSEYYDDWYLFAVEEGTSVRYSLFKMREEESDGKDNDDPGVTIPFISINGDTLISCLNSPTQSNRYSLFLQFQRATGPDVYAHDDIIAGYFSEIASKGPYLIAEKYTTFIASTAVNGTIEVPDNCISALNENSRISDALDEINSKAGYSVFRESDMKILIDSPDDLSLYEKQAILTCFTADVTFNSFAAEVQFHAESIYNWKSDIPLFGDNWYERALRADMAIGEEYESGYYDEYYDLSSDIVQNQIAIHGEY